MKRSASTPPQLSDIIDQFEILDELETSGVEPTGHAGDLRGVMREDAADESLPPDEALRNAPPTRRAVFSGSGGAGRVIEPGSRQAAARYPNPHFSLAFQDHPCREMKHCANMTS